MTFAVLRKPGRPGSGLGAHLLPGEPGFSFRVWAPNALAVDLLIRADSGAPYDRFGLSPDPDPGCWSADLGGVVPGHQYRFEVTNDPARGPGNPGGTFQHVDPRARQIRDAAGDSPGFTVDPSFPFTPFTPAPPQDLILYQMQVGSFRGKNDTVHPPDQAASFRSVIEKLPYLRAMNFNAVQLLPAGQFPGDTGEGYAPTNFFAPESSQGTPDDLRALVDACHQEGLAVFFDVIYNHVPDDDDNLWQFDGYSGNRGGGIYFADADRSPWGWRLAADRPAVHDFFADNARMWLGEFNGDGLRFDSLHNVYPEGGAAWLVTELAAGLPSKILIAEHDNPGWALARYPLEAVWDMASADTFRDDVLGGRSISGLESLLGFGQAPHAANLVRYLLGSHDQIFNKCVGDQWQCGLSRYFVERVGGVWVGRSDWTARAQARLGWALNVAMPGTPMLFMGTEVHHSGYWCPDPDQYGDHRFDWALTADLFGQQMIALVTDANRMRAGHPALRTDTLLVTHRDDPNGVLAFKRWNDQGDVLLTVVNLGESQFDDPTYGVGLGGDGGQWEEIFNSQSPRYGGWNDSGNYLAFPRVQGDGRMYIRLPKISVLVFRKC
jgi:1,4-alpha-glucan branching enzyme